MSRSSARFLLGTCLAALLAAPLAGDHAKAEAAEETAVQKTDQEAADHSDMAAEGHEESPDTESGSTDNSDDNDNDAPDESADAPEPASELSPEDILAEEAASAADKGSDTLPDDLSADTVIASIAETPITLGELLAAKQALPAEFQQLPDEILMQTLVEQIANQILLAKAASDAKLDQKTAVQIAVENQKRAVLAGAYLSEAITERVTDEAIEAYYKKNFTEAEPVKQARAAHILVEDEASATEIKEKLDEGAEFAALASEYGTDATASRGGDLGWFSHEDVVPAFADAAFAMEPGTISEPVQTSFGWHLIKLNETRTRPVPPLSTLEDEIVTELAEAARVEIITKILEGSEIEYADDEIPPAAIRADALLAD